jgi:uncharacterized protein YjbI with pentapeptide repeats
VDIPNVFAHESRLAPRAVSGVDFGQQIIEGSNQRTFFNLTGIDLSHVDLMKANLTGANLSHADFSYGPLSESLRKKDFPGKWIYYGAYKGANLSHANLSQPNLSNSNLSLARLDDADL